MGVGRYTYDNRTSDKDDLVDLGFRFIWRNNNQNWSFSAEALQRWADTIDDSQSYKALIEYQINDTFSIIASYGKDFDGTSDLIAIGGINIGWGKGATKMLNSNP